MDPSSKNYRDSGVPSDLEKAAGSERDRKISAESTACGGSKEGSMSAGSVEEAANSTRENGEGAGTKEEPTSSGPLDWDGPDDPANPFNWSSGKRWFGTIVPGCLCTLVYVLLYLPMAIANSLQNNRLLSLRPWNIRSCPRVRSLNTSRPPGPINVCHRPRTRANDERPTIRSLRPQDCIPRQPADIPPLHHGCWTRQKH